MKAPKGAEGFWAAVNATGPAKSGILKIVTQVLLIDGHIPTSWALTPRLRTQPRIC
jgi:hypothetical protein